MGNYICQQTGFFCKEGQGQVYTEEKRHLLKNKQKTFEDYQSMRSQHGGSSTAKLSSRYRVANPGRTRRSRGKKISRSS